MPKNFDLAVIGTGSAAAGVASRCRDSGWKVAIIDSRPYGGTCALRGCDPKKVLVGATEARSTHEIRRVRPISSLRSLPSSMRKSEFSFKAHYRGP